MKLVKMAEMRLYILPVSEETNANVTTTVEYFAFVVD